LVATLSLFLSLAHLAKIKSALSLSMLVEVTLNRIQLIGNSINLIGNRIQLKENGIHLIEKGIHLIGKGARAPRQDRERPLPLHAC
jgi:hypothetical protein